jgi:hypothetical protein
MSQRVIVQQAIVGETLRELAKRRWRRTERVALWLARRSDAGVAVQEMYVPRYEASSDYFHIPRASMVALMGRLSEERLMIGAQLHTHPREAFHSAADDRWAIVRHAGALSIVIPEFGQFTTIDNFLDQAKVFSLSTKNAWIEVPRSSLLHHMEVLP